MKRILIVLIATVGFFACTDDLNVQPTDQTLFLEEEFYAQDGAYRQALAGVYGNLTLTGTNGVGSTFVTGIDAGTSQWGRSIWNLMELTTDEAIWSYENDPGLSGLNRTNWNAENIILRGAFSRLMVGIALANEFLRQSTPDRLNARGISSAEQDEIQTYRAEARFIRALNYYYMMDFFGKAPFVLETDVVGAFQGPEVDRAGLFEFVESELLEIEPLMADPLSNEYGRVDRASAWMLLAKIYLNAEVYIGEDHYSEVITYTENVINAGFALNPVYLNNFKGDNNEGAARDEIIFPVQSDGAVTQNYGPTTVMVNGQVGSLEGNGNDLYGVGGWGGALRVTREFSELLLEDRYTTDDRNTLISDTEGRSIDIPDITDRDTGYIIGKWSALNSDGSEDEKHFEIVNTDYPLFRLADAHLMYAEAVARGGGGSAQTAIDYINALRTRANNPNNTLTTSDLTLDLILDERAVELHWEGHRRQDLVRFGLFTGGSYTWSWKGNSANGIPIAEFRKVFALPTAGLAANTNLTQNEGY